NQKWPARELYSCRWARGTGAVDTYARRAGRTTQSARRGDRALGRGYYGCRRRKANSHYGDVIEGFGVAHEALDIVVEPLTHCQHAALLRLILYGPALRHDALQAVQHLRCILRLRDPIGHHEEEVTG